MLFIVRKVVFWVACNTSSIENGPTMFFMTSTILIAFGSAFFTDVIGVHAIFGMFSTIVDTFPFPFLGRCDAARIGAFLARVIVPRDGGLTIALAEKLEDIVTEIFLPLVRFSGLYIVVYRRRTVRP